MWFPVLFIAAVLVVGTAAALVWWRIADRVFPGADAKAGYVKKSRRGTGSGPAPRVISGFKGPGQGGA